jgi:hypothetical protein
VSAREANADDIRVIGKLDKFTRSKDLYSATWVLSAAYVPT